MLHDPAAWRGYFAASPTPFTAGGDLDTAALAEGIRWFVAQGAHGIVVNGTTGEWFTQTMQERKRVADVARDNVPADTPFLIGVSSARHQDSIELAHHARHVGADGVLLTIPSGRRLEDHEIVAFYQTLTRSIEIPMLVYNVPSVAGRDIAPGVITRSQAERIVGVKDNTPSVDARLRTLRDLRDRAVFSDLLEPETYAVHVAEGVGRGQIGSAMPLGRHLADVFEYGWRAEWDRAQHIVDRFAAFKRDITEVLPPDQPWHSQIKALMHLQGVDVGYPRFPATSALDDPEQRRRLEEVVTKYPLPPGIQRQQAPRGEPIDNSL